MLSIESQPAAPVRPANGPRRLVKPRYPAITTVNHRHYNWRSGMERYKAELRAFALGVPPNYPPPPAVDVLVPLKIAAQELGVGRRTIGRRIADSQSDAGE